MRKLMISSILATDMGLHFDYMKKLGDLQEKLEVDNTTEGWNGRMIEEQKALACALLIKCADISNVVSAVTPLPCVICEYLALTCAFRRDIMKLPFSGCISCLTSFRGSRQWSQS